MSSRRNIVVCIAGPFRGATQWEQFQNIRRAETLALAAWRAGFAVICPHTNTAHFQGELPDEAWLLGDLTILARCDALLTTPDWYRSEGARGEVAYARTCDVQIFQTLPHLELWADKLLDAR